MKKLFNDPEIRKNVFTYSLSGIIIIIGAFAIFNIDAIFDFLANVIHVLSPFIWGVAFAFIMSKFANFIENKFPEKWSFKVKRLISSILSVVLLIGIIVFIVSIVAPQLVESISSLSTTIVSFTSNPTTWLNSFKDNTIFSGQILDSIYEIANSLVSSIFTIFKESLPTIVNATIDTAKSLLNFVIGFIVAIYLLIDRERIIASIKKTLKAYLPREKFDRMVMIFRLSISKFYKFFEGKLIDSLIIGVLCFIIMTILGLNYSMLISVIVGVTNIIPFFGPFIGAVPSALILLMVDPVEALIFVIMVLILQQVDGNIIGPKILGDSVGLSSLWIMFAIIVGGAYFGFFGMLLGVPVFSVIHYLINENIEKHIYDNEYRDELISSSNIKKKKSSK